MEQPLATSDFQKLLTLNIATSTDKVMRHHYSFDSIYCLFMLVANCLQEDGSLNFQVPELKSDATLVGAKSL